MFPLCLISSFSFVNLVSGTYLFVWVLKPNATHVYFTNLSRDLSYSTYALP